MGGSAPTQAVGSPQVELRLAGEFAVARGGTELPEGQIGSRKSRTLLKLLAVERPMLVPVDRIVEVLWDAKPPAAAEQNVATLVSRLRAEGHWVRGVDIKYPDYEQSPANEFLKEDLRSPEACEKAVEGIQDVYQLAADMGGIGYITANRATLSRNNILINSHMLEASRLEDVERYF